MKHPNKSPKSDKTLDVRIEKIVPNGYGLGFADGLTVFVSLAAAGDRLRVKINQRKGKTAFAEIVEVLEPSPARVTPPCIYFGRCGGCDFQQMDYRAQLEAKKNIVRDCLARIGKIDFAGEIDAIGSPRPFGYRSRAQWHLDTRRRRIGYFRRNSHDVIDVAHCPIITDELQKTLTNLRAEVEWESFWAERVEVEAANAGEEVSIYSAELVEPTREISFQLDENRYFYDAQSFFQGNLFLVDALVETALRGARGKFALDLYCGVGLFTLPMARTFERVFGVEASAKSIRAARKNLEHARLETAEFFSAPVGEWLAENEATLKNVAFILLDPPRAGTEKETIERLLQLRAPEISYVSCEPSTLARDLRLLCADAYEIESITALDLFPQTHHVETVVRLKSR
ncbi:MAG TPA: class I SAM-dependent RNA methyltransferase [Pyrinomonadaceae bacterium]